MKSRLTGEQVVPIALVRERRLVAAFLRRESSWIRFLSLTTGSKPYACAVAAINGVIAADVMNTGFVGVDGRCLDAKAATRVVRAFNRARHGYMHGLTVKAVQVYEERLKKKAYARRDRRIAARKLAAKAELAARRACGNTRKACLRRQLKAARRKVRKTSPCGPIKPTCVSSFPSPLFPSSLLAHCKVDFSRVVLNNTILGAQEVHKYEGAAMLPTEIAPVLGFEKASPSRMYMVACHRMSIHSDVVRDLFPAFSFEKSWKYISDNYFRYRLALLFDRCYAVFPLSSLIEDTLAAIASGMPFLQWFKEAYATALAILRKLSTSMSVQGFSSFIGSCKSAILSAVGAVGDAFFRPLVTMLRAAFDDTLGKFVSRIPGLKAQIENFWTACVSWAQNLYSKLDLSIRVLSGSAFIAIGLLIVAGIVYFVETMLMKVGLIQSTGTLLSLFIGGTLLLFISPSQVCSASVMKIRTTIVEVATALYGKPKSVGMPVQGVGDIFGVPLTIVESIGNGLLQHSLESMTYVGKFGAAMDNIRKGVMCARQFFGWLIEQVGIAFDSVTGRKAAFFRELSTLVHVDVEKWVTDSQQFLLEANILPEGDRVVIDTVHILLERGHTIQRLLANVKSGTSFNYARLVATIVQELNKVYTTFTKAGRRVLYRTEPFWLYVYGKSHCGKTIFLNNFKSTLIDYLGTTVENIYYKNARDQFWPKYRQQKIVCVDDLSSVENPPSLESEFIQLIATCPYGLNMAAVDEKGAEFNSEIVLTTSNKYTAPSCAKIHDMEAYNNRRTAVVEMRRVEGKQFDPRNPFESSEARYMTNDDQSSLSDWMPISEMRASLLDKLSAHRESQAAQYLFWKSSAHASHDVFDTVTKKIGEESLWLSNSKMVCPSICNKPASTRIMAVDGQVIWFDPMSMEGDIVKEAAPLAADLENQCLSKDISFSDMVDRWDVNGVTRQFMETLILGPTSVDSLHSLNRDALASHKEFFGTLLLPQRAFLRLMQKRINREKAQPVHQFKIVPGSFTLATFFKDSYNYVVENGGRIFLIFAALILVLYFASAAFTLLRAVFFGTTAGSAAAVAKLSCQSTIPSGSDVASYAARNMRRVYRPASLTLQSGLVPESNVVNADDQERILNALVRIDLPDGNIISAMRFRGRSLCMTYHQAMVIEPGTLVRIVYCDNAGVFKTPIEHVWDPNIDGKNPNLIRFSDTEICVYKHASLSVLPAALDSIFVTDVEKLPKMLAIKGSVVKKNAQSQFYDTTTDVNTPVLHCWTGNVIVQTHKHMIDNYAWGGDYSMELPRWLNGNYICEKQDCGALITAKVDGAWRVVGMHVAGEQLPNGSFMSAAAFLPNHRAFSSTHAGPSQVILEPGKDTVGVQKVGWLLPQDRPHTPGNTCFTRVPDDLLVESPVETKQPAILRGDDARLVGTEHAGYDPLRSATKKCEQPMQMLDRDLLLEVAQEILDTWYDCSPDLSLLTDDEMVNGNDEEVFIDAIVKSTSEGYPYCLHRPQGEKGKERFLCQDPSLPEGRMMVKPGTAVHRDLQELEIQIFSEVPTLWSMEIPKDENLPLRKIVTPKTRTFSVLPMPYNLLLRKYTGRFIAFLQQNRSRLPMAVGINPYSREWTRLYDRLAERSPVALNGDYASFDGLMNFQMYDVIATMINKCYKDDFATARYNLILAMHGRMSICGSQVYELTGGMPSGCAMTVVMNSIFNEILIRYAYRKCMDVVERPFRTAVTLVVYGDDNLIAIAPEISSGILSGYDSEGRAIVRQQFNGERIRAELAKVGVTITDGSDKTSSIFAEKPLGSLDFLKRGFNRQLDGRVLAPLDKTAIFTSLTYVRAQNGQVLQPLFLNVVVALRELYLHPDGFEIFHAVRNFYISLGDTFWLDLPTWAEVVKFHQVQYSEWIPFSPHKFMEVVVPKANKQMLLNQAPASAVCVVADQTVVVNPGWRNPDPGKYFVVNLTHNAPFEISSVHVSVATGGGSGRLPTTTWVNQFRSPAQSYVKMMRQKRAEGFIIVFRDEAPFICGWVAAISFLQGIGIPAQDVLPAYTMSGGQHPVIVSSYFQRRSFQALPSNAVYVKV